MIPAACICPTISIAHEEILPLSVKVAAFFVSGFPIASASRASMVAACSRAAFWSVRGKIALAYAVDNAQRAHLLNIAPPILCTFAAIIGVNTPWIYQSSLKYKVFASADPHGRTNGIERTDAIAIEVYS